MDAKVIIDLSDPAIRSALTFAAIAWGIGVLIVAYNIVSDLSAMRAERSKNKPRREKRVVEPCATDLHVYAEDEDVCTRCKQSKEPLP